MHIMLMVTNMATVRKVEFISEMFNVVGIGTRGNYAQECISKLSNY
jgi:hypothetical protein